MDIDTFWRMIEASHKAANGDQQKQRELLVEALTHESAEDIIEFDQILDEMMDKAALTAIWEAGYFIHCIGGDSVWTDFRCWLISQGKGIFEKALENPDSLAYVVDIEHRLEVEFETFCYVGMYAYERKTGQDMPLIPRERSVSPQTFEQIHDEEEWPQLFPALMAKLGSCKEWFEKYRNRS